MTCMKQGGSHESLTMRFHPVATIKIRTSAMLPTYKQPAEPTENRVPDVTFDFWLIKLMAVTMGETAADYLAVNLGLGLTVTSLIMTGVLVVAIVLQFAQKRYVPWA